MDTATTVDHGGYFTDRKGDTYGTRILTWSDSTLPDFPAGTRTYADDDPEYRRVRDALLRGGFAEFS